MTGVSAPRIWHVFTTYLHGEGKGGVHQTGLFAYLQWCYPTDVLASTSFAKVSLAVA